MTSTPDEIARDDIVEHLRSYGCEDFCGYLSLGMAKLCADAADEIERLRAALAAERSREATEEEVERAAREIWKHMRLLTIDLSEVPFEQMWKPRPRYMGLKEMFEKAARAALAAARRGDE